MCVQGFPFLIFRGNLRHLHLLVLMCHVADVGGCEERQCGKLKEEPREGGGGGERGGGEREGER